MTTETRKSGYYYAEMDNLQTIGYYNEEQDAWLIIGVDVEYKDTDFTHIGLPVPTQQEWMDISKIAADKIAENVTPETPAPIPFDWERYKMGGWQAVTRCGRQAVNITESEGRPYIIGAIRFANDLVVKKWCINGYYFMSNVQHDYDLLMYKTQTDATTGNN